MKETSKTIVFVCIAAAMVALAAGTYWSNRPVAIADFGSIGQPFFEAFTSSKQAESLEVYALDKNAKPQRFQVRKSAGLWRIPSHYDYPAEAADRLAATATSVIGLAREALAGRNASEHERFGVLDPSGTDVTDPEDAGKRLVLKDGSGNTLADFIIGKEVTVGDLDPDKASFEQDRNEKFFFVRRADENQTYKVKLKIDLSTKFADWINPDLLQIESRNVVQVDADNYRLEEQSGDPLGQVVRLLKVKGEPLSLRRKSPMDSWKLEGLDETTNQLDMAKVNQLTSTPADLKIVGVRKQFKFNGQQLLTADLKLNQSEELLKDQRQFEQAIGQLQDELAEKGFNIAPAGENSNELMLVSEHGELTVGMADGVLFKLHFGKPVKGDEQAIEIGAASTATGVKADVKKDETAKTETAEKVEGDPAAPQNPDIANAEKKDEGTDSDIRNRYVMIRVMTDAELLGLRPVAPPEPVKPQQPEGYLPKPEEKKPAEVAGQDSATPPPVQTPVEPRDPKFEAYDQELSAYEQNRTQFEMDKTRYESEVKAFDEKIKGADKRVAELNERYGSWYYVVSASNLESLRVKRSELIQPKKPTGLDAIPEAPQLPPRPNIDFDETKVDVDGNAVKNGDVEKKDEQDKDEKPPPATESDK